MEQRTVQSRGIRGSSSAALLQPCQPRVRPFKGCLHTKQASIANAQSVTPRQNLIQRGGLVAPRSAVELAPAPSSAEQQAEATSTGPSTAYPFTEIEKKWQDYWAAHKTFRTPDEVDTTKPKYYVLDMFPYPR